MELFLPFLLLIFASFFQGTFGLGMKYMNPMSWESWWVIHVLVAMILFPMIWAYIAIPDLFEIISSSPRDAIFWAMALGFAWGVGGIMFGVSVPYIGLSLTMGIVMGLAGSAGSLIPLFQIENATSQPSFPYIIAGLVISLIGVAITAKAGIDRDKLIETSNKSKNITKGILIAVTCGLLSSLLNVGFANAAPVAQTAIEFGVIPRNSSLAAWVVVLWGAFLMNFGYSVFLLFRNNSWNTFSINKSLNAYKWAIIAGFCWFAALGLYGQGAALMNGASDNNLGNIVGWPMLLGLSLIVSNIWAYNAGEWKDAKKPFNLLLIGLAVLIIASIVLGYSNSLN